ncbi:MAG: rRNA maturation RNase YbeY [Nitrospirae bacterium]|nr:rRNA maturation RNase YbeY [Nitrospirota bacterium]
MNLKRAELDVLFVGSRRMKIMNNRYRAENTATDVLSFPQYNSLKELPGDMDYLLGDIVVNIEHPSLDAAHGHIDRLLVHGLLHLAGYDHEKGTRMAAKMFKKEEEVLSAVKKMAGECQ